MTRLKTAHFFKMDPITLYARRFDDSGGHVPFLAPWWGEPREDPDSLHAGQFKNWAEATALPYAMVSSGKDADLFVLSIPWKRTRSDARALAFAESEIRHAADLGKLILIFFDSDHDEPVVWPAHAVVFRFSIYADTRRANEFSMPTFSQDFLAPRSGGVLRLREKSPVPVVSFCGYAPPLGCRLSVQRLRETARETAYRLGLLSHRRHLIAHAPRVRALRTLRRTAGIDARFILRDQFAFNRWGVLQPGGTPASAARQRAEFVENLDDADYALCARGLANCSIRFYEALSLGRIPVFINTACVLPYDWLVPWRHVCVWIEEHDLADVGRRLRDYHRNLTPEDFAAKQRLARELFVQWLSPEGFFRELHLHFRRSLARVSTR
jgi:hypothetical protein